jgi:ribosomal protein S18 acetylase RimI-like enzyme
MYLRPVLPRDCDQVAAIIKRTENFNLAEKRVALELIADAVNRPEIGYRCLVALADGGDEEICLGYACYGQTPMTKHTYDLYWIVVDGVERGRGVGHAILEAIAETIRQLGGKIIRVETSTQESYGGTLQFYAREGFVEGGRIPDFYKDGDDLLIYYKNLD